MVKGAKAMEMWTMGSGFVLLRRLDDAGVLVDGYTGIGIRHGLSADIMVLRLWENGLW
tara:strand:+ start:314 stop:487 length:174 start_codon:yes stop_codon:yes gene_type:complete